MPLLCFKCKTCGAILQVFDDEIENNTPSQSSDNHQCEWVRVDNVAVAVYTQAYTTQYPQWDSIMSADKIFKEETVKGDKERHETQYHKHLKK